MIHTPRKLGWIPDLPDYRDYIYAPKLPPAGGFPPSHRLVWMPGALDQGSLGSCTANAVAGLVHFDRIAQRELYSWSPSRLFNYYNARAMQGWESLDTGAYIRDAVECAATLGNVQEDLYPYDISKFTERPPPAIYDEALKHKSYIYRRVGQSVVEMKASLAEGYPFAFGFSVYENFNWSGPDVQMPSGSLLGGHAVVCCGYDDAKQRFDFLNSWGGQWGTLGRGTIPYDYLINPGMAGDFWQISRVA